MGQIFFDRTDGQYWKRSESSRSSQRKSSSLLGAVSRALDLFYLTIEDSRWKGRLKEILRVRELFAAAALGSNEYKTSLEDLDRYFDYSDLNFLLHTLPFYN